MATRSMICKVYTDGSVEGIYCHWDGYPDHQLPLLKGHYTTDGAIQDLLALGDLSSLGASPQTCEAYHRDRGEPFIPSHTFSSLSDLLKNNDALLGIEWVYAHVDGDWKCYPC